MSADLLEGIVEYYADEEILKADGFDDAVIGVDEKTMRLIYSVGRCIEILVEDGMTMEDAMEYFDFNVSGAWVGDKTPIWSQDMLYYVR
tara:strand:+ start:103 stop:369 length:267 start_codon:yes stop_codon:yes gene_type:complete